jgi:hypothetical protein
MFCLDRARYTGWSCGSQLLEMLGVAIVVIDGDRHDEAAVD